MALPGRQGDMGIYPNHVPLMTKVAAGEVVTRDGQKEMLAVGEGFAEVTGDRVSILTDVAALEAEIDNQAEEALKAAEDRLKGESLSDEQVIAAEAAQPPSPSLRSSDGTAEPALAKRLASEPTFIGERTPIDFFCQLERRASESDDKTRRSGHSLHADASSRFRLGLNGILRALAESRYTLGRRLRQPVSTS